MPAERNCINKIKYSHQVAAKHIAEWNCFKGRGERNEEKHTHQSNATSSTSR